MVSLVDEHIQNKFDSIEQRILQAFDKIKAEMDAHVKRMDNMATFIRQRDSESAANRKAQQETQEKLQGQVSEFDQKVSQLRIALSSVKSLKNELVVRRDLAKIEERIRESFRKEIDRYKNRVKQLKEIVREEKKAFKTLEKRIEKLESRKPVEKVVYKTEVKTVPAKTKAKSTKNGNGKTKKLPKPKKVKQKRVGKDRWSFFSNFEFE